MLSDGTGISCRRPSSVTSRLGPRSAPASPLAPERKPKRSTHLVHLLLSELCDPSSDRILGHREDVVEVHGLRLFKPVSGPTRTSDGTSRIEEVIGATVTRERYGIADARVSTSTGRDLSGAGKRTRRISPRSIRPATLRLDPRPRIRNRDGRRIRPDPAARGLRQPGAGGTRAAHPARAPIDSDDGGARLGRWPAAALCR
jgi:hypothetical protein